MNKEFSQTVLNPLLVLLGVVSLLTMGYLGIQRNEPVSADTPTFFFSDSSDCTTPLTALTTGDNFTLWICIDGQNEGTGLLGAEIHLPYDTESISVGPLKFEKNGGSVCNAFSTCIDLSSTGEVKILAASSPTNPQTDQTYLAGIPITLLKDGPVALNFSTSQVINQNQSVEIRDSTGMLLTIDLSLADPLQACGNGVVDSGEQCDDGNLNDETCSTLNLGGGTLSCSPTCMLNTSGCALAPAAGECNFNGIIDLAGEECDGSNLGGLTCQELGYTGGSITGCVGCVAQGCTGGAQPLVCNNNGIVDGAEECDGSNLGGVTCQDLGYASGTVTSCNNCVAVGCSGSIPSGAVCGNGNLEGSEECDDSDLINGDGCSSTCQLETSEPEPTVPVQPSPTQPITSLTLTSNVDVVLPGAQFEVYPTAYYQAPRASENVTSCRPPYCPTPLDDSSAVLNRYGNVTYYVSGPGAVSPGSNGTYQITASPDAKDGDTITVYATYLDKHTNTSAQSDPLTVTVQYTISHCENGIKDSDETAIDCGGSTCNACVPHCSNSTKDADETDVDCGGNDCSACALNHCEDGIKNSDETGVDCGGAECTACFSVSGTASATPEGRSESRNFSMDAQLQMYSTASSAVTGTDDFAMNAQGQGPFDVANIPQGNYHIGLKGQGYLLKILRNLNVQTSADVANLNFNVLTAGDITGDDVINALDIAKVIYEYATSTASSDLNKDGSVNAPDISMILGNYLHSGESY